MAHLIADQLKRRAHLRWLLLALAPFALAGCVCDPPYMDEIIWAELERGGASADTNCDPGNLARLSQFSAELTSRADPALLLAARRDAERECREGGRGAVVRRE